MEVIAPGKVKNIFLCYKADYSVTKSNLSNIDGKPHFSTE